MSKILLSGVMLLTAVASQGAFKQNFDSLEDVGEVSKYLKVFKNTAIVEEAGGNKMLRVNAPLGLIKIPVKMSKDISLSFDWRSNAVKGGAGEIVRLCDYNHGKIFFRLGLQGGEVRGSSYVGKKLKFRKLTKVKAQTWYRIDLSSLNGKWYLTITEKGNDNDAGPEIVVFDSVDKNKTLRTNRSVAPKVVMFSQWDDGVSFDYDNLLID